MKTKTKKIQEEKNIVEIGIDYSKGDGIFQITYNDGEILKTSGKLSNETEKVIRHLQASVMMNWDRTKQATLSQRQKCYKEFIERIDSIKDTNSQGSRFIEIKLIKDYLKQSYEQEIKNGN